MCLFFLCKCFLIFTFFSFYLLRFPQACPEIQTGFLSPKWLSFWNSSNLLFTSFGRLSSLNSYVFSFLNNFQVVMMYVLHMPSAKKWLLYLFTVSMLVSFCIAAIFNGSTICWRRVGRKVVQTQNPVYILESLLFLFPWESISVRFQRSHGLCSSQQSCLYHCLHHIVMVSISLLFFSFFFSGSLSQPEDQIVGGSYFPCVVFGI